MSHRTTGKTRPNQPTIAVVVVSIIVPPPSGTGEPRRQGESKLVQVGEDHDGLGIDAGHELGQKLLVPFRLDFRRFEPVGEHACRLRPTAEYLAEFSAVVVTNFID